MLTTILFATVVHLKKYQNHTHNMKNLALRDKNHTDFTFHRQAPAQTAGHIRKTFASPGAARTFLDQFSPQALHRLGTFLTVPEQPPPQALIKQQAVKDLCSGPLTVTEIRLPSSVTTRAIRTRPSTPSKNSKAKVPEVDNVSTASSLDALGPPTTTRANDKDAETTEELSDTTSISETQREADPVSMITGEELLSLDDFILPGPVPFLWQRVYRSSNPHDIGLGTGWTHTGSERLLLHDTTIDYIDNEGRHIPFKRPTLKQRSRQLSENLALDWDTPQQFSLHQTGQPSKIFTHLSGNHYRLSQIRHKAYIPRYQYSNGEWDDAQGYALDFHYNTQGQLTRIQGNLGRGLVFDLDTHVHITAIFQLDAHRQRLTPALAEYDHAQGDLIAQRNANGHGERYAYINHIITQRTLASGFNFHFEWDQHTPQGRCQRQWGDHNIYDYTFRWEPDNHTSQATDSLGHTVRYRYDATGRICEEIDKLGERTRHEYNAYGQRISSTDSLGNQTRYHHDEQQRYVGHTDALGHATSGSYFRGEMTHFSDAAGNTWQRRFDAQGLLIEISGPYHLKNSKHSTQEKTTHYTHNRDGLLTQITDPIQRTTRYHWDKQANLIQETDPQGNNLHYQYDDWGRITTITAQTAKQPLKEARQHATTRYRYTASGQIQRVTTPQGEHSDFDYNPAGHLTKYTDGQGRITEYRYTEGLSQPSQRIDPAGHVIRYEYDKERNLTALINENGDRHTFTYDANERLIQETGFDGRTQTYVYNAAGHLIQHQDANQIQTDFDRDALGRLSSKLSQHLQNNAQPTEQSKYRYDPLGQLIETYNAHQYLAFDYDAHGNITHEHQHALNAKKQRIGTAQDIHHQYNILGQRTDTHLPDGNQLHYDYHASQGLQSIHLNEQRITHIQRDSLGRETTRQQGELHTQTDYDPQGRLQRQHTCHEKNKHSLIQRDYGYDSFGNLNRIKDGSEETRYVYDTVNRLKRTEGTHPEFFDFDPAGNILAITDKKQHTRTTPGLIKGNRLLMQGDKHFEYDARGNLTRETRGKNGKLEKRFYYDLENQLIKVETNTKQETVTYRYDPLGRRIDKTDAFGTTQYRWADNHLTQETRNNLKKTYVYEPHSFRPVALVQDEQIYHYHLDHLGTPRELTNEQGKIVWRVKYKTYGNTALKDVEEIENNLRFQGQYYDEETGLHYNRHRYYNPDTGQFINQDPIGLLGGINNYQYADNPTGWIDPLGLCKEEATPPSEPGLEGIFLEAWLLGGVLGVLGRAVKVAKAKQAANLKDHLYQADKYGQAGVKELQNGKNRYYGNVSTANKPGEMAGRRTVREWDPATGNKRTWHETVDHNGNVRIVRPQRSNNTKTHYQFDANGNYTGKF